jgi:BirA family transcriptional regulator, biotin operon repressor / biotin---[acetyl-CoA-carboxylase] ligase
MTRLQPKIVRFDSLPSTNTEAARQAGLGAREGLCVVAAEQTQGRGRLERRWLSPAGAGLYCSIVLRPSLRPALWTLIPLMAGLAIHEALRQACDLATDIKWPNDVLVANRKLSGTLAETIETSLGRAVIVGIGINLTSAAFPAELAGVAISVQEATGRVVSSEVVLQALVVQIAQHYDALHADPAELLAAWQRASSYAQGKRVRITTLSESFEATTLGLESDGALRVETDSGEVILVRAGDVASVRPTSGQVS